MIKNYAILMIDLKKKYIISEELYDQMTKEIKEREVM